MKTHSFHTDTCPEAKHSVGPILNVAASMIAVIAPLNAVPQIIKIFQTQSVADISLLMYLMVLGTQAVWLLYAFRLDLKPLLVSSVVVILLSGTIVLQFFWYADVISIL